MTGDEQFAKRIVDQRIELINSILSDLAIKFDFQFSFNYSLFNPHNKALLQSDTVFSRGISVNLLDYYIQQLAAHRFEQQALMNLIADGALVYMCTDDSNRPEGVKDWIEEGKIYLVNHIYPAPGSDHCVFSLYNMDPSPCTGYKGGRFQQIFNRCNFN